MTPAASRFLAIVLGLAVGGAFLALAFRGTPPAAVAQLLATGRWGVGGALVLLATAAFVLTKAARWRLLLGSRAGEGGAPLWPPVLAGLALNALVPHSGEFVRAMALQRRAGRAPAAVLSSIVAERVFDLFAVLILGAVAFGSVEVGEEVATALRLLAGVAAAGAVAILVLLAAPGAVTRLVGALARPLPVRAARWVRGQLAAALAGFEPVRSPSTALAVLLWSIAQWLTIALAAYGCGLVVGLALAPAACFLVVVGIVVAFLLPNAPGYAGSVQVAFLVTLKPLGVAGDAALAASVVYQLLMVLPLVIGGLVALRTSLRVPLNAP